MHKNITLTILLLSTFVACQKRTCPQSETYNGLYNAITCDYKSQIFNLEQNLSNAESMTIELQKKKNNIEKNVHIQENQLTQQKQKINDEALLLSDIEKEVDSIKTGTQAKEVLENLNVQIKSMHKTLKEEKY